MVAQCDGCCCCLILFIYSVPSGSMFLWFMCLWESSLFCLFQCVCEWSIDREDLSSSREKEKKAKVEEEEVSSLELAISFGTQMQKQAR